MFPSLPFPVRDSAGSIRRSSQGLLLLGIAQLALFLGTAIQDYYWGNKTILLAVHAGPALAQQHRHLSTFIQVPVGTYSTGTEGSLLYHATSLWDYALFYRIGDLALPDALFLCGLGVYLHRALRQLAPGREFSLARTTALFNVGVATAIMFTAKMVYNVHIAEAFETKTQHFFHLASRSSNVLYAVFGLLLVLCASFLQRGEQLQRESDLTV